VFKLFACLAESAKMCNICERGAEISQKITLTVTKIPVNIVADK